MTDIYSLTYEQAERLLTENGFRATQCGNIFRDIYKRRATSFDEMTLTSADIKALLSDCFFFGTLKIDEILQSVDTIKYLLNCRTAVKLKLCLCVRNTATVSVSQRKAAAIWAVGSVAAESSESSVISPQER